MPPPPRARTALVAMKNIGFSSEEAAPILRKLLEVYESNWEYIEDNNYQVLIDSILEAHEAKASTAEKQAAVSGDDSEHSRKRIRKLHENLSTSTLGTNDSGEILLKKPTLEADVLPEEQLGEIRIEPVPLQIDDTGRTELAALQFDNGGKITEPISTEPSFSAEKAEQDLSLNRRETRASARARKADSLQDNAEHLIHSRDKMLTSERSRNLVYLKQPKIEPDDKDQQSQVQANVAENFAAQKTQGTDKGKGKDSFSGVRLVNGKASHEASFSTIDIASSDTGAVKLQFSFKTYRPDFHLPSVYTVFKVAGEKYLQQYKISQPDFSLLKVMKEVCQFASELTAKSNGHDVKKG